MPPADHVLRFSAADLLLPRGGGRAGRGARAGAGAGGRREGALTHVEPSHTRAPCTARASQTRRSRRLQWFGYPTTAWILKTDFLDNLPEVRSN